MSGVNENNFDNGYNNYNQHYGTDNGNAVSQPDNPKKESKAGFVAGIIVTALVVGGVAGFAGSVIGNNIGTVTLPSISSNELNGDSDFASSKADAVTSIPKPEAKDRLMR